MVLNVLDAWELCSKYLDKGIWISLILNTEGLVIHVHLTDDPSRKMMRSFSYSKLEQMPTGTTLETLIDSFVFYFVDWLARMEAICRDN